MKLLPIISLTLSLLGCAYQVIDISHRYFSYTTNSKVKIYIIQVQHIPTLSLCWKLMELMKPFLNDRLNGREYHWKVFYQILKDTTVEEIFKLSPHVDTILKTCAIKESGELSWRHPWYNNTECNQLVNITKYIHRLNLCYKVEFLLDEPYDFRETTLTPSKPGIFYMLFLNPDIFINSTVYTASIHGSESSPLFDSIFTIENSINPNYRPFRIGVVYTPYTIHRLAAPYETMCREIPGYFTGTEYALHYLNIETMKRMKHVHTLEHVEYSYKYPIFDTDSYRNKTISDEFEKLASSFKKYHYPTCSFQYRVPKTWTELSDNVSVIVNWPQDPGVDVMTIADYAIIDFIIYICSSIGIWLGLSVYSTFIILVSFALNSFKKKDKVFQSTWVQNSDPLKRKVSFGPHLVCKREIMSLKQSLLRIHRTNWYLINKINEQKTV